MVASKQARSRHLSVQQMKFHFLLEHCCHGNLSLYEGHSACRSLQPRVSIRLAWAFLVACSSV